MISEWHATLTTYQPFRASANPSKGPPFGQIAKASAHCYDNIYIFALQ